MHNDSWDCLGCKGSVSCILIPAWPGNQRTHFEATFDGVFEMGQYSVRVCGTFSLQMQALKDAATELGHI